MNVVVLKPGLLTTLQDRGRSGFAALGVGHAGPMDSVALRLANALVGNTDDAVALEITLLGPRLRFDTDAVIALTGATFDARLDTRPMPGWQAVRVSAGQTIDCGRALRGARAYLAVRGGFETVAVLGSAATDVSARIGPFGGRPLRANDELTISAAKRITAIDQETGRRSDSRARSGAARVDIAPLGDAAARADVAHSVAHWSLDPRPWFDADAAHAIHLIRGHHFDALDAASRAALFCAEFRIAADSNRVGFRFDGVHLAFAEPLEVISEAVAFGTLQLPPSGAPIVLMAEHPTIGGYPRIGQVAAIDLPRLAQRRPGDLVRFREIGLDDAQTRYLQRERELTRLLDAIAARDHA